MKEKDPRGRPTLSEQDIERTQIRTTLTLYFGEDDDLIDWFDGIPDGKRAEYIKTALRAGGMTVVNDDDKDEEFISDDLLDDLLGSL